MGKAARVQILDHRDPSEWVSMRETIEDLQGQLPRLVSQSQKIRFGSGSGEMVLSANDVNGPGFRAYVADRDCRADADDLTALFQPGTGRLDALFLGPQLGAWRVGALAGVAISQLAPDQVDRVAVFGAGLQARAQILALAAVRTPSQVTVFARSDASAFVRELRLMTGLNVVASYYSGACLRDFDTIITATSAKTTLFAPEAVNSNALIIHVGAKAHNASEVAWKLYAQADVIETDAKLELSMRWPDLVLSRAGVTPNDVRCLSERQTARQGLRVYMSLGLSGSEVAVGRLVWNRMSEACRQKVLA